MRANIRQYTHQAPERRPTTDPRLLKLKADLQQAQKKLDGEKEHVGRIEMMYATLRIQLENQSSQYTLTAKKNRQLEEENRALKKEVMTLRDSNKGFQVDVENNKREFSILQKQVQANKRKIEKYDDLEARENELLARNEDTREELTEEFAKKCGEVDDLWKEIVKLTKEITRLEASERRLTQMESETRILNQTIADMKNQLTEKDSTITRLEENVALKENTNKDLNARLKTSDERVTSSEQRVDDMNARLRECDGIIAVSEQKVADLSALLEASDSRVARSFFLEDKYEIAERGRQYAEEKANKLEKDIENVTAVAILVQEESAVYSPETVAMDEEIARTPPIFLQPTEHHNPAPPLGPGRGAAIKRKRPKRQDKLAFKRRGSQPRNVWIAELYGSRVLRLREAPRDEARLTLQAQRARQKRLKLLGWDRK